MKKDDSNDLGAKGALSEDLLTQVAGGSDQLGGLSVTMKCRACDWQRSATPDTALSMTTLMFEAQAHSIATGHETYRSVS